MKFFTFFSQQLTLNISNLPTYPGPFKCRFSGYGVTRETKANRISANANTLTCETPYPNELPQFPVKKDVIRSWQPAKISGNSSCHRRLLFLLKKNIERKLI
jgi:hypothetical protein